MCHTKSRYKLIIFALLSETNFAENASNERTKSPMGYNTGWTVLVRGVRLNCIKTYAGPISIKFTRQIFALTLVNKNNLTKAVVLFLRRDIQTDVTIQLCASFIHFVHRRNEQISGKISTILHSASGNNTSNLTLSHSVTRTLQFNKQKHVEAKSAFTQLKWSWLPTSNVPTVLHRLPVSRLHH
jgi:hypothetical protein